MTELKELVKICKGNKIDPWYVEEVALNGGYELADEGLFSYAENDTLNSALSGDIIKAIRDVYFNGEVADLPEEIKLAVDEAIKVLSPSPSGMVTDWLVGISDYPFDLIMSEWIGNDRERALEVYSYLISKER